MHITVIFTGFVIFTPGQRTANFSLYILEDDLPEMDESVFVRLTNVQILEPQQTRPGGVLRGKVLREVFRLTNVLILELRQTRPGEVLRCKVLREVFRLTNVQ